MNYQKTIIAGRLAHTPELKALPNGTKIATFSLAVNRTWTDKESGKKTEVTDWHDCVAFGRIAETLNQYCEGGQVLLIEGRNQTRSWQKDDEKTKRYKTEVVVEGFQFGARSQARVERKEAEKENQEPADWEKKAKVTETGIDYPDAEALDINPDDIPF